MTSITDIRELSKKVLDELTMRGFTLALAESCTGGLATSFLTDFDGASEVLQYGIVAYSTESKEEFLGIPTHVIHNYGTISLECAKIMAESATIYDADIGLATTGVLGETFEQKLKGTVFIAVAIAGQETFARELTLDPKKNRFELKLEIIEQLFNYLLASIEDLY